jgi:hypothetical protein
VTGRKPKKIMTSVNYLDKTIMKRWGKGDEKTKEGLRRKVENIKEQCDFF